MKRKNKFNKKNKIVSPNPTNKELLQSLKKNLEDFLDDLAACDEYKKNLEKFTNCVEETHNNFEKEANAIQDLLGEKFFNKLRELKSARLSLFGANKEVKNKENEVNKTQKQYDDCLAVCTENQINKLKDKLKEAKKEYDKSVVEKNEYYDKTVNIPKSLNFILKNKIFKS